jgi:Ca2+-binding RTX toxin-like protein
MANVQSSLGFTTNDLALWPGAGQEVSLDTGNALLITFDAPTLGGDATLVPGSVITPKVDLSYELSVDNVVVGAVLSATLGTGGLFDLNYPVNAILTLPDQIKAGETFEVKTSVASVDSAFMAVSSPKLGLGLTLVAEADVGGFLKVEAGGESLTSFTQARQHVGGEVPLLELSSTGVVEADAFASFRKANTELDWTDDILGGRKVMRTPVLSLGASVGPLLEGWGEGRSDNIGRVLRALPDLTVHLTPPEEILWADIDIDDLVGRLMEFLPDPASKVAGGFLVAQDWVYRNRAVRTDLELGAFGANMVIGLKPYIDFTIDVQGVDVTLRSSDGTSRSGSLGQSFTFTAPPNSGAPLKLDVEYALRAKCEFTFGVIVEGGIEVQVLKFSGTALGLDVGDLAGRLGLSHRWPVDADGSLIDWLSKELFTKSSDTLTLGTVPLGYSIPYGPSTVTPVAPAEPSNISVVVAGTGGDVEVRFDEGTGGARPLLVDFQRSGNLAIAVDVNYRYTFGADLNASDFSGGLPQGGVVHFAAGQVSATVTLQLHGDSNNEADERLSIIAESSQASIATPVRHVVIQDDDTTTFSGSGLIIGTVLDDTITGAQSADELLGGPGDDVIDAGFGSDVVRAGAGDDTIKETGRPSDSDTIDGGDGTDTLNLDFRAMSAGYYDVRVADGSVPSLFVMDGYGRIRDTVAAAISFTVRGGSASSVTYDQIERVNYSSSATGSTLVIYQGGVAYKAGSGQDTFFADWSDASASIIWDNDPSKTQTVNGVVISGMERLLLATGSGNDVVSNTRNSTNDEISTGPGNDLVDAGPGSDVVLTGAGDDTIKVTARSSVADFVDGGEGVDQLDLDCLVLNGGFYEVRGPGGARTALFLTDGFVRIHDALVSALSFVVSGGSASTIEYTGIEHVDYQSSAAGAALVIYQNGSVYRAGSGPDTFYADWSTDTEPIVWANDPAKIQDVHGASITGMDRLLLATGSSNDRVSNLGGYTDDEIFTGAGNDIINPGRGRDWVDGGAGIDTVVFDGAWAGYQLTRKSVGWSVRSPGEVDELTGVERLRFDDRRLALDLDGNAGTTAKVIGALFGKAFLANPSLAGIGLSLLDGGTTYEQLVSLALGTDLFAQLAGSTSESAFIQFVYRNVVGHGPSAAELGYYVGLLDSGAYTRVSLAVLACETPQNAASIDLVGLAVTGLEYGL